MKINTQKPSSVNQLVILLVGLTICYQMVFHGIVRRMMQNDGASTGDVECASLASSVPLWARSSGCLETEQFRSWQQRELDLKESTDEDLLQVRPAVAVYPNANENVMEVDVHVSKSSDEQPSQSNVTQSLVQATEYAPYTDHDTELLRSSTVAPIKEHFDKADTDSNGFLDWEELMAARRNMGHKDPSADARRVIGLLGKSYDEKISIQEFLNYNRPQWREEAAAAIKATSSTSLRGSTAVALEGQEATTVQVASSKSLRGISPVTHEAASACQADQGSATENMKQAKPASDLFEELPMSNATKLRGQMHARPAPRVAETITNSSPKLRGQMHAGPAPEVSEELSMSNATRLRGGMHARTAPQVTEDLTASSPKLRGRVQVGPAPGVSEELPMSNATRLRGRMSARPAPRVAKELTTSSPKLRGRAQVGPAPAVSEDLTTSSQAKLRGRSKRLSWSDVGAWNQRKALRGSPAHRGSVMVAGWQELREARWESMIPKVSCITVIPSGRVAKIRMAHFVNNFRLQDYDGLTQLVLVYRHGDEEAKQIVDTYADGSYIKGTPAFGEEALPSTVAFRYGAWVSDGDVVAHWDFGEFHHPWRLALQVRALALTSRPASFFRGPAVPEDREQQPVAVSSMLGERAWMREYWHPLLSTEGTVLENLNADRMVEVDVVALRRSARTSDKLQIFSALPMECFESARETDTQDEDQVPEKVIEEKLGSEMRQTYRGLLTKRAEVQEKLVALCAEAAESIGGDDAGRQQQLGRLVAARAAMNEHFQALSEMFKQAV